MSKTNKQSLPYGQIIKSNLHLLLPPMQNIMSVVNEPKLKQNTKIVEREIKIRKPKRHQNSLSTLDRRLENCCLAQAVHEMHCCGNEIHLVSLLVRSIYLSFW